MSTDNALGCAPGGPTIIAAVQRPADALVAAVQSKATGSPTHRLLLEEAR